ncbi:hypothetical protein PV08_03920 [Exophiala spinifera]|uniref:C3H1-type domain-containing protein n=1 Tax=Exophiala spinifera TaxID=91928 RepID=A0A0D1YNP7_9EURO|nr:uncharacterized protein PV08_03920 [Exophiala spinifera]KIW16731.1 hypothetical protein PV08_03920 [Exophiala spinifera]
MPETSLLDVPSSTISHPKIMRSTSYSTIAAQSPQSNRRSTQPLGAPTTRHSSNPIARSPLQQSFPAYPGSTSAPSSPPLMPESPSRRSRVNDPEGRKRGESRSSSVPIVVRNAQGQEQPEENARSQPRTQPQTHASSPSKGSNDDKIKANSSNSRRSVKHLTCFWWWEKGHCRFSDEDCLYSHYDTGHHTSAPRQVIAGEPAKAGKSLERELTKMAAHNRSNTSIASYHTAPGTPHGNGHMPTSIATSSRAGSPTGPGIDPHVTRSTTPFGLEISQAAQLRTDNDFLRTLVQQTQREKAILVEAMDSMKKEKTQQQAQIEAMQLEHANFLHEREILHATIRKLQTANPNPVISTRPSVSSAIAQMQTQSPWGAIGSRRVSPIENAPHRAMNAESGQYGNVAFQGGATGSYNPAAMPYVPSPRFPPSAAEAANEKFKDVLRNLGPGY